MQSPFKDAILTVSEFLEALNIVLKPCVCSVQGEVGEDFKRYPTYSFFKLMDKDGSVLNCFAWGRLLDQLGISLAPGTEVRIKGYPSVYARTGSLSFQVEQIELVGAGDLKKQFKELFQKLEKAGYFDASRKRPLPRFCSSIGLITSKQAVGALNDFKKHLAPFGFSVALCDTRVEGAFAAEGIIKAIGLLNASLPSLDAIVLMRGGGAWETFQPFNTEEVVRAIASSAIPIVSAIGHEKDETLADFAADVRASTPTHASSILSDPWNRAARMLPEYANGIGASAGKMLLHADTRVAYSKTAMNNAFQAITRREGQAIRSRVALFARAVFAWNGQAAYALKSQEEKLSLSNPVLKLKQGYSVTLDKDGRVVKDAGALTVDQIIQTRFHKGRTVSIIQTIHRET